MVTVGACIIAPCSIDLTVTLAAHPKPFHWGPVLRITGRSLRGGIRNPFLTIVTSCMRTVWTVLAPIWIADLTSALTAPPMIHRYCMSDSVRHGVLGYLAVDLWVYGSEESRRLVSSAENKAV